MGILLSVFRTGKYTNDEIIDYNNAAQKAVFCEFENSTKEFTITIHLKKRRKKSKTAKRGRIYLNEIKNYLNTVCEQIRFQKAHDIVKKKNCKTILLTKQMLL